MGSWRRSACPEAHGEAGAAAAQPLSPDQGVPEPGPQMPCAGPNGHPFPVFQDSDVAYGSTDTPVKTLEADGDQERLISKPREGRGRRPGVERLSWPKFQAIKTKRGPRRSRSSSEAYERDKVPDVSPTSSDAEARIPAEEHEQRAGSGRRRRRLLNLRFKVGSEMGPLRVDF